MVAAPTRDLGYLSDTYGVSVSFVDTFEVVSDLIWPMSVRTFAQMRNDPQLTAVLNAYTLPLRAAPKYVDPAGCREEVVQMVADDLGLPILGADDEPGPARRRGVTFSEHFRLALLHLAFGHMPFEERYEIKDGKARLAAISDRMPQTIRDIALNPDGSLAGIQQNANVSLIPENRLVWYVREREGAAWQGRSMLRSAYGAWLLKHEAWRIMATSGRRFGMGVPSVEAPAGATPAQIATANQLASNIRAGDSSGIGMPFGYTFKLTGMTGSAPDMLGFTRYLDQQMAQMALASVLNLDASPNGSRALGETLANLLLLSLRDIAGDMADVITRTSVRMVDYNWGEDEPAPRIVIGDIGSRPETTAEALALLVQAGALIPDPSLDEWIRERYTLPERQEVTPPPASPARSAGPVPPATPPAPETSPAADVAARRARRPAERAAAPVTSEVGHRDITEIERASGVDPKRLNDQWQGALDALIIGWGPIARSQRDELTGQIEAAVAAGKITDLQKLSVSTDVAENLLTSAMDDMATEAMTEMRREAASQGVAINGGKVDTKRLGKVAKVVVASLSAGLTWAAAREAIRVWGPGKGGDAMGREISGMVHDHLESLSDAYLRLHLGNAASAAQNAGRQAVIDAGPTTVRLFASEVLDRNTCDPCQAIDGTELSQEEAQALYASGGYVECLGRERCRGIVVTNYDTGS